MFWKLFTRKQKEAKPLAVWVYLQIKSRAWGLRVSGWLGRKTATLSPGQLKGYGAMLLVIAFGWHTGVILEAMRHPAHLTHSTVQPPTAVRICSKPPLVRDWRPFQKWLDSLQADSNGRKIYDTIRRERPGLLDSLRQVEKYSH
jgi:hypothetical protein